jgi:arylsulfatase A-like enzyme
MCTPTRPPTSGLRPLLSLFLLTFCLFPLTYSLAAARPNIIVIVADDYGYADVGFNGCTDIPPPNLDSLARRGARFSNGYVTHPYCSPSRAGLLSGRYQQRFGHEANPTYLPEDTAVGLPVTETLLPRLLADAGYVTGAVGKWHLGAAPCFRPAARGFAESYGFLGGGHQYLPLTNKATGAVADWKVEYNAPLLKNGAEQPFDGYMTDILSREAAAFVTRHTAEPFFLYVAYNAVHTPLQAPEKYLSRLPNIADPRRRTYAAMTVAMDDGVGQVLAALRAGGIEKDTQVWFFSDNGGPATNVAPTCNAPLRGHKGSLYEGGIRVPFVLQWPAAVKPGTVIDVPVISLDLFATALAVADAKPANSQAPDGLSLLPLLKGDTANFDSRVLHWRDGGGKAGKWAIRQGRWKLVRTGTPLHPGPLELFDLAADISEAKNLASENPEIAARLQKLHDAWNAELIEPLFQSPKAAKKKNKPER